MNPLGGVTAWVAAHKSVLLAGGGVTGLAVIMRMRSKNTAAAATTPAGVVPAVADTTSTDTYNALNDELTAWEQGVQAQIDGLSSGGNSAPTPVTTPPAPTPTPTPAPVGAPHPPIPAKPAWVPRPITTQPVWQFRSPLSQTQLNALTTAQRNALAAGPYVTIQPGDPRAAAGVYSAAGILMGPLGAHPTGQY